jgi:hypothetical protein
MGGNTTTQSATNTYTKESGIIGDEAGGATFPDQASSTSCTCGYPFRTTSRYTRKSSTKSPFDLDELVSSRQDDDSNTDDGATTHLCSVFRGVDDF